VKVLVDMNLSPKWVQTLRAAGMKAAASTGFLIPFKPMEGLNGTPGLQFPCFGGED